MYRPTPLSEREVHIENTANVKGISKEMKEKLVACPDAGLNPGQTDGLTVCCKINLA
jgi:hypothetical protein